MIVSACVKAEVKAYFFIESQVILFTVLSLFCLCVKASLCSLCVVICRHFVISLNHSWIFQQWHHCMSFHVLRSLDVCLCVFCFCVWLGVCVCVNVFVHGSIKKKKVPLCYNSTSRSVMLRGRRQDRANQGWYVHRQWECLTENTYGIKRNWKQAGHVALINMLVLWKADISRCR